MVEKKPSVMQQAQAFEKSGKRVAPSTQALDEKKKEALLRTAEGELAFEEGNPEKQEALDRALVIDHIYTVYRIALNGAREANDDDRVAALKEQKALFDDDIGQTNEITAAYGSILRVVRETVEALGLEEMTS